MAEISIQRTTTPKPHQPDDQLSFGKSFTDHMFMLNYDGPSGWHDPRIVPYQTLTLDPATCVLHYAQAIFDGLKAFRGADDVVAPTPMPPASTAPANASASPRSTPACSNAPSPRPSMRISTGSRRAPAPRSTSAPPSSPPRPSSASARPIPIFITSS
jgi:hypothetical protein